jgi:hypothetical protein
MDANRESARPVGLNGRAWLQQVAAAEAGEVYRLYLVIPADCPN